jgi:hypothetical protein
MAPMTAPGTAIRAEANRAGTDEGGAVDRYLAAGLRRAAGSPRHDAGQGKIHEIKALSPERVPWSHRTSDANPDRFHAR